jgi:hypothetical protein
MEEDIERWGVAYGHRLHQLPFLSLCHHHHIPLLESPIDWSAVFTPLPQSADGLTRLPCEPSELQIRIAKDCADLAGYTGELPSRSGVFTALRDTLIKADVTTGASRDSRQLANRIERKFGSEALQKLGLPTQIAIQQCTLAILRNSSRVPERLGVHHVSLFCALAGTALLEILDKAHESQPELGPWPCQAEGEPCYGKRIIERWRHVCGKKSLASFCCPECGTVYVRPRPLRTDTAGRFEHRITLQRALPPWAQQLRDLWLDESQTWMSLSEIVGQTQQKIGRVAASIGLPDIGRRRLGKFRKKAAKVRPWSIMRDEKRASLSKLMQRKPGARQWNSTPGEAALLIWFQKYDPVFLRGAQGAGQPRLVAVKSAKRKQRDERCSEVVARHCDAVMAELRAVPARITVKLLVATFRRCAGFDLIRSLKRFPLTKAKLLQLVESSDAHFERILSMMEKSLCPQNRPARRIDLFRKYRITPSHYRRDDYARRINDLYYGRGVVPGSARGANLNQSNFTQRTVVADFRHEPLGPSNIGSPALSVEN